MIEKSIDRMRNGTKPFLCGSHIRKLPWSGVEQISCGCFLHPQFFRDLGKRGSLFLQSHFNDEFQCGKRILHRFDGRFDIFQQDWENANGFCTKVWWFFSDIQVFSHGKTVFRQDLYFLFTCSRTKIARNTFQIPKWSAVMIRAKSKTVESFFRFPVKNEFSILQNHCVSGIHSKHWANYMLQPLWNSIQSVFRKKEVKISI